MLTKLAGAIGEPLRRVEDDALIVGKGRFADDLHMPDLVHAVFARAPHPHARILNIDVAAARAEPGVLAVLTGADIAQAGLQPIPHSIGSSKAGADVPLANPDGSERASTPHMALPHDRVRFVGEAFAMVVAESVDVAKSAAELIDVDWDVLPAVTDAVEACDAMPVLWDQVPGNLALHGTMGDPDATDAAFADAAHVVRFEAQVQRVTGVHMEPRAAVAYYDNESARLTLHASSGIGVVAMRDQMAVAMNLPPEAVRVAAPPNVGGNFGTRNAIYPEYPAIALAARMLRRPVKHVAERGEAFLSDYQGRDLHIDAELAIDEAGRFLALRAVNTSNIGAHTVSYVPLNKGAQLMTGLYRVPAGTVTARAAMTNTPPTIPYRSAGRPEAMYAIERIIDIAAREIGIDRIELRRRNMLRPEEQPFRNPFGVTYDNGDYVGVMDKALELAEWHTFDERRAEALGRGRWRGIGMGNYIEGTSGIPRERAEIRINAEAGVVDVVLGTQDTGQGHVTAFSQLVGAMLGVPESKVRLRTGDTDFVSAGGGSHSGRSLRFSSIVFAQATAAIIEQGRAALAALVGRPVEDVTFDGSHFRVAGSNETLDLFDLARRALPAHGPFHGVGDAVTPGLAFPYGCAVCEVEIDPETGGWKIMRYVSVDDVGRALNPMIIDGQTHGGIVQGAGQALMEWSRFDPDSGQALAASMMDYALPRASDFPSFFTEISEVPAANHPLGFRPGGEGGTTPALGVVTNAIVDALAHLGVRDIAMPATPARIWDTVNAARAAHEGRERTA